MSRKGKSSNLGDELVTEAEKQAQCLIAIRKWVETEAGFYGRTEEDFLIMFLRSCEFDLKLTKHTLTSYYESRRDLPEWWANRNVMDDTIFPLLQLLTSTALKDGDIHQPTVFVTRISSFENTLYWDEHLKIGGIFMEAVVRRPNSQINGVVWIIDCHNYRWPVAVRCLNPFFARNFVLSFHHSLPLRMPNIIFINTPAIGVAVIKLFQRLVPEGVKLLDCGSDWSKLGSYVPLTLLPEEYGGYAGPIKEHEDAFLKEVISLKDYILDDNKYGFK